MTEFQHIDWCSSTGEYGAPDCDCPGAEDVRAAKVITPESIQALLLNHRPAICERMHFVCAGCNWHETFKGTPEQATEESNQRWWGEFIDHLTAPTENKGGLN
jgi:hypothetical protein